MKKTQIGNMICAAALLLAVTGCGTAESGKEPGGSITIVEPTGNEAGEPGISVVRIDTHEKLEISDWMDSGTVIVSKENEFLEKMKLEELSDSYPRSLYLYDLDTGEYRLLKEEKQLNLGGARLSPGKKSLLYYGSSLGDLSYYVLDLESHKSFGITGGSIGSAGSARWTDGDTVIGAGYTGGAYSAGAEGEISSLKELEGKSVFLIEKIGNTVYYNTTEDGTLMALDLSGGDVVSLGLSDVFGLYPAPDQNQLLVLQYQGPKQRLLLCDRDGSNEKTIAEGVELGGVSWSPDQRLVAYSMKTDGSGAAVGGLYLYDMLTGKSTQIAVDIRNAVTCWSPSGEALAYAQWDGRQYNSSIISLEYSLQK